MKTRRVGWIATLFLSLASASLTVTATADEAILFQDDFENGNTSQWRLEGDWQIEKESGNSVLSGNGPAGAWSGSGNWTN